MTEDQADDLEEKLSESAKLTDPWGLWQTGGVPVKGGTPTQLQKMMANQEWDPGRPQSLLFKKINQNPDFYL